MTGACALNAGAGRKGRRVVRGGSWNNNRDNARCAYRNRNNPDNSNDNRGFRCVSHAFRCVPAMPRVARRRRASRVDAGRGLREMARPVPGRRLRKAPGEYRMALPPVVARGRRSRQGRPCARIAGGQICERKHGSGRECERKPQMNSRPVTQNTLKRVGSNLFEQVSRISRRIHSMAYRTRTGQYLPRVRFAEKK